MTVFTQFENRPLLFAGPRHIISCSDPAALDDAFLEIEQALDAGFHVAGFLSYEAGACFEKRLADTTSRAFPLLMMGVYPGPSRRRLLPAGKQGRWSIRDMRLNISKEAYTANIDRIRRYIADGDVYQITYCLKLLFGFSGDPRSLYADLLRAQPVPYPAFIETDSFQIASLSPERFMKKTAGRLVTEPMKGTWPRGRTIVADTLARSRFARDAKNRAENVMIVDLLRNDIARIGTGVRVPKLFTVTPYTTLFQMTSTVTGKVPERLPVRALFAALFPSGSVTGAPKIRAMEIIRAIENDERRIYTGAIGWISPGRDCYFNIPIRTILFRKETAEMGIGGGIVWDSTAEGEWQEGLLKARFITDFAKDWGK